MQSHIFGWRKSKIEDNLCFSPSYDYKALHQIHIILRDTNNHKMN